MSQKAQLRDLVILGCGPTLVDCPYDGTEIEIWSVNGGYTIDGIKRISKLFMTDMESEVDMTWYDFPIIAAKCDTLVLPERFARMDELGLPIEIYPIEDILSFHKSRFYSNSICFMIAQAIMETTTIQEPGDPRPHPIDGWGRILMYGIDLMTSSTYVHEKGGVEHWCGRAEALGIEVVHPRGSATGKTFNGLMYGYYGQWEQEHLGDVKERLFAPWDLFRSAEAANKNGFDWVKNPDTEEFERIPVDRKALGYKVGHLTGEPVGAPE